MSIDLSAIDIRGAVETANRRMVRHRLEQAIALLPAHDRDSALLLQGIRDYLAAGWQSEGSADRLEDIADRIGDDAATLVEAIRGEAEALRDWKDGIK